MTDRMRGVGLEPTTLIGKALLSFSFIILTSIILLHPYHPLGLRIGSGRILKTDKRKDIVVYERADGRAVILKRT